MPTRRTLLLSVLVGVSAFAGWRLTRGDDVEAIVAVIRKRLDYLTLDEAGLEAFARDLLAAKVVDPEKWRLVRATEALYLRLPVTGKNLLANRLRHGEERTISLYLLSSDFFIHQQDETRVVRYLGYYDPLKFACANPFARLTVDSASA